LLSKLTIRQLYLASKIINRMTIPMQRFQNSIVNLLWGVLFWKRETEKDLEASGMNYCIVRPGRAV
jgi:hypothetical protein